MIEYSVKKGVPKRDGSGGGTQKNKGRSGCKNPVGGRGRNKR